MKIWQTKHFKRGFLLVIFISMLSVACGKKGPLYIARPKLPVAQKVTKPLTSNTAAKDTKKSTPAEIGEVGSE